MAINSIQFQGKTVLVNNPVPSDHIAKNWKKGRFYEAQEGQLLHWVNSNIPRGGYAVDVGAHIGNHTLFLHHIMEMEVFFFEPCQSSYDVIGLNVPFGATGFRMGVSDKTGEMALREVDSNNTGMNRLVEGGGIPVDKLDNVLNTKQQYSFIKFDCEGMELKAITGGFSLLSNQGDCVVSVEVIDKSELSKIDSELLLSGFNRVPDLVLNHTPTYIYRK